MQGPHKSGWHGWHATRQFQPTGGYHPSTLGNICSTSVNFHLFEKFQPSVLQLSIRQFEPTARALNMYLYEFGLPIFSIFRTIQHVLVRPVSDMTSQMNLSAGGPLPDSLLIPLETPPETSKAIFQFKIYLLNCS